jgi:hypothetical protein
LSEFGALLDRRRHDLEIEFRNVFERRNRFVGILDVGQLDEDAIGRPS